MLVKIILEHRFKLAPNSEIWTDSALPYSFWVDYLKVFQGVNIVARVERITTVTADLKPANGAGVEFTLLPHYIGPRQFILKAGRVFQTVTRAMKSESAVVLRTPGILGTMAYSALRASRRPYAVQVVGDPYEVFAPGAVRHPLRPLFRWWFTHQLKLQCRNAIAVSYVTRSALQQRYPTGAKFTNSFSNVELPAAALIDKPRIDWQNLGTAQRPCRLILIGSLAQLYKGPDILLQSVSLCIAQGLHLDLTILGDGKHRSELEELAQKLKISKHVHFAGQLPSGEAVREALDQADLFVLPSRTEGLPRAMIEAMARGLPCIGSSVGGIPELLSPKNMVAPSNVEALARKITEVVSSPARLETMSSENIDVARTYSDDILSARRVEFFKYIKEYTEDYNLRENSKQV